MAVKNWVEGEQEQPASVLLKRKQVKLVWVNENSKNTKQQDFSLTSLPGAKNAAQKKGMNCVVMSQDEFVITTHGNIINDGMESIFSTEANVLLSGIGCMSEWSVNVFVSENRGKLFSENFCRFSG